MKSDEIKAILDKHMHWIRADCDGWESMRADLSGTDLSGTSLSGAGLSGADLSGADLSRANLSGTYLGGSDLIGANLSGAGLRGANLNGADLRGANLTGANLIGANLSEANLIGANLSEADLHGADLHGADLSVARAEYDAIRRIFPQCCPDTGAFIGWKRANGYIVKLCIADDAMRSSAFGRKCRCSKAEVLAIETLDGADSGIDSVMSSYDSNFAYRIGETVEVSDFNPNWWDECSEGIHFFITRQEAVEY